MLCVWSLKPLPLGGTEEAAFTCGCRSDEFAIPGGEGNRIGPKQLHLAPIQHGHKALDVAQVEERGSRSRFWPSAQLRNKVSKHPWGPLPPFSPPHQSSGLILQNYRPEHGAPAVSKQVSAGAVDFKPEAQPPSLLRPLSTCQSVPRRQCCGRDARNTPDGRSYWALTRSSGVAGPPDPLRSITPFSPAA